MAVRARSRRSLEEQLVRFPRVLALAARVVWWFFSLLPARSWLRKAIVRHYARLEFEAVNRRDFEAQFALYHPDGESFFPREMVSLGWERVTRGREARERAQRRWNEEWGEFRFEPEQVVDLADGRFMLVGRTRGSGLSSGAAVDHDWAIIFTLTGGKAIREQVFFDYDDAFDAAGLPR